MATDKFNNSLIMRVGLISGLIGGGTMIFLSTPASDIGLGFIHGYLFIINYLLVIYIGLTTYKKWAGESSTYLKRFKVGFLIYSLTTISFIIYSVVLNRYSETTTEDNIFFSLILVAFGLILSSLFALCFKPVKNNYA